MSNRIRISTKADQFQVRIEEHLRAGYRIEDEQPVPVNGLCSFTAVLIVPNEETSISEQAVAESGTLIPRLVIQAACTSCGFHEDKLRGFTLWISPMHIQERLAMSLC